MGRFDRPGRKGLDLQLGDRLIVKQVLLKDALQGSGIDAPVFDRFRMNNYNGAVFTDRQTVGQPAGGVLRMLGIVQAMLGDEGIELLLQLPA